MSSRVLLVRSMVGLAAGGLLVAGVAAGANPVAASTTATFNYTGSDQSFVVPTGVTTVAVVATGGGGGGGRYSGNPANPSNGGAGAIVTSNLSVTPGQTLTIAVGGGGQVPVNPLGNCGGGGGSTIITQASTDVIVAGGGGGGGVNSTGGPAGNSDGSGSGGLWDSSNTGRPGGGNVGGTGAGGAAGTGNTNTALPGTSGTRGAGGNGSTGSDQGRGGSAGGAGGTASGTGGSGGGGGGAGYGGGGGGDGTCFGGGGGGSFGQTGRTFAPATSGPGEPGQPSTGSGTIPGTNGGDGQVTITYTASTPATPSANPGTILPANAKIKKNGTTKVTSANAKTSTGQRIKTRVKCQQRTRGDIRLCKVIHKANGATYVRTYGIPLKITITWYASATSTSKAYKKVRVYNT